MRDFEELLGLINKSDIILISYQKEQESKKDDLVSYFNKTDIAKFNHFFCFTSFFRSQALAKILQNDENQIDFLVFDLNKFEYKSDILGEKNFQVSSFCKKLVNSIYSNPKTNFPSNPIYKVIITTETFENNNYKWNLTGGNGSLFISDLALIIENNKIRVIKNRLSKNGEQILYETSHKSKSLLRV